MTELPVSKFREGAGANREAHAIVPAPVNCCRFARRSSAATAPPTLQVRFSRRKIDRAGSPVSQILLRHSDRNKPCALAHRLHRLVKSASVLKTSGFRVVLYHALVRRRPTPRPLISRSGTPESVGPDAPVALTNRSPVSPARQDFPFSRRRLPPSGAPCRHPLPGPCCRSCARSPLP